MSQVVNAQFFAAADASVLFPLGHFKSQVDLGYGPEFKLGYELNNNIAVALGYELLYFKTMQPDYKMNSVGISFCYKFVLEKYKPYLGIKTGFYQTVTKSPINIPAGVGLTEKKQSAFGFAPATGVIFDTGFFENVKFDISISYSTVYFENHSEYLSLHAGLCYFF